MVGSSGKHYIGGQVQYVDHCDADRWSKLEVGDVLEKLSVDVSRLEYYYLKPEMSLDEGLVRLFDNISSMEMAELGVQKGVVDLYAVDINDVVVSQITQENVVSGVGRVDNIGVGTVCVDVGGVVGGEFGDGDGAMDVEAGESGYGAMDYEAGESGDGDDSMDYEGGEIGVGDRQVGTSGKGKTKKTKKAKGTAKGKGNEKATTSGKGKGTAKDMAMVEGNGKLSAADGVRSIVVEVDPAGILSSLTTTTTSVTMMKM